MSTQFVDNNFDIKDIKSDNAEINSYLLENNTKQIQQTIEFLGSKSKFLLINGFMGTGKSTIINHAAKFLSQNSIVLRYNCFETTILDDILLSFFEDFKNLIIRGIIPQPKAKFDNFTKKIESFFEVVTNPIVIIIDSFDKVLKSNKSQVLDFLFYLSEKKNIKIIMLARTFDYNDFEGKVDYKKLSVLALDKSLFEKFLRSEGIKLIGPVSDELYKHSRGYFLYVDLSIKIIKNSQLSLIDFIQGYTNSFLSYNDFILREAMSLIDPVSGHLFRFLTIIRHPVSINLLKTIGLYDEEKVNYFIANSILTREKDTIYLQDYFKEIYLNSITDAVLIKLHKSCIDLYTTQLPLKPLERGLLISRQTMRAEIDYHKMFIPQKPNINSVNIPTLSPMEYSAEAFALQKEIQEEEKLKEQVEEEKIEEIDTPQPPKEIKIKDIDFVFDSDEIEQKIMNDIENSINNFVDYSDKVLLPDEDKLSLSELINCAKNSENEYNYNKTIAYCQRALLKKDDSDFHAYLPIIYDKLANSYSKLADWFNALRYFNLALEFYTSAGDIEKINQIKLFIANIFYITFKHDKAKSLVSEIFANQLISNELRIRANMLMADLISNNPTEANHYYEMSLELCEDLLNKKLLAELYFKYALSSDELNKSDKAVKYYKKCLDIETDNPHRASAMSNLAGIFDETGAYELAKKYYLESLKIDEENKNYGGIYVSCMKLADMYRVKSPEKTVEFFTRAINCARAINEYFYIISAYLELGDFYNNHKKIKFALKNYLKAFDIAKNKNNQDDIEKISQRIADIKVVLGGKYDELEQEILNEE